MFCNQRTEASLQDALTDTIPNQRVVKLPPSKPNLVEQFDAKFKELLDLTNAQGEMAALKAIMQESTQNASLESLTDFLKDQKR